MTDIEDIYRLQSILCRLEMASDQVFQIPMRLLRPVEEELLDSIRKNIQELRSRLLDRKLKMFDRMKEEEE